MIQETLITGERSRRTFTLGTIEGSGSFGQVFSAQEDGYVYAVKLPDPIKSPLCVDKLTSGAIYQEEFSHPHITPVVLFDTTKDLGQGGKTPFLVMPLAETTLECRIAQFPLPIQEAITVSEHTADALIAIHAKDLLFKDLCPENVLLYRNHKGQLVWKLTDFGQVAPIDTNRITVQEQCVSPEIDQPLTPISEQFDWAINLVYPAVTGIMIDPHLEERPSFQSLINPANMTAFHEALEEVVSKAMQDRPSDRYPNMTELLNDLRTKRAKVREAQNRYKRFL